MIEDKRVLAVRKNLKFTYQQGYKDLMTMIYGFESCVKYQFEDFTLQFFNDDDYITYALLTYFIDDVVYKYKIRYKKHYSWNRGLVTGFIYKVTTITEERISTL